MSMQWQYIPADGKSNSESEEECPGNSELSDTNYKPSNAITVFDVVIEREDHDAEISEPYNPHFYNAKPEDYPVSKLPSKKTSTFTCKIYEVKLPPYAQGLAPSPIFSNIQRPSKDSNSTKMNKEMEKEPSDGFFKYFDNTKTIARFQNLYANLCKEPTENSHISNQNDLQIKENYKNSNPFNSKAQTSTMTEEKLPNNDLAASTSAAFKSDLSETGMKKICKPQEGHISEKNDRNVEGYNKNSKPLNNKAQTSTMTKEKLPNNDLAASTSAAFKSDLSETGMKKICKPQEGHISEKNNRNVEGYNKSSNPLNVKIQASTMTKEKLPNKGLAASTSAVLKTDLTAKGIKKISKPQEGHILDKNDRKIGGHHKISNPSNIKVQASTVTDKKLPNKGLAATTSAVLKTDLTAKGIKKISKPQEGLISDKNDRKIGGHHKISNPLNIKVQARTVTDDKLPNKFLAASTSTAFKSDLSETGMKKICKPQEGHISEKNDRNVEGYNKNSNPLNVKIQASTMTKEKLPNKGLAASTSAVLKTDLTAKGIKKISKPQEGHILDKNDRKIGGHHKISNPSNIKVQASTVTDKKLPNKFLAASTSAAFKSDLSETGMKKICKPQEGHISKKNDRNVEGYNKNSNPLNVKIQASTMTKEKLPNKGLAASTSAVLKTDLSETGMKKICKPPEGHISYKNDRKIGGYHKISNPLNIKEEARTVTHDKLTNKNLAASTSAVLKTDLTAKGIKKICKPQEGHISDKNDRKMGGYHKISNPLNIKVQASSVTEEKLPNKGLAASTPAAFKTDLTAKGIKKICKPQEGHISDKNDRKMGGYHKISNPLNIKVQASSVTEEKLPNKRLAASTPAAFKTDLTAKGIKKICKPQKDQISKKIEGNHKISNPLNIKIQASTMTEDKLPNKDLAASTSAAFKTDLTAKGIKRKCKSQKGQISKKNRRNIVGCHKISNPLNTKVQESTLTEEKLPNEALAASTSAAIKTYLSRKGMKKVNELQEGHISDKNDRKVGGYHKISSPLNIKIQVSTMTEEKLPNNGLPASTSANFKTDLVAKGMKEICEAPDGQSSIFSENGHETINSSNKPIMKKYPERELPGRFEKVSKKSLNFLGEHASIKLPEHEDEMLATPPSYYTSLSDQCKEFMQRSVKTVQMRSKTVLQTSINKEETITCEKLNLKTSHEELNVTSNNGVFTKTSQIEFINTEEKPLDMTYTSSLKLPSVSLKRKSDILYEEENEQNDLFNSIILENKLKVAKPIINLTKSNEKLSNNDGSASLHVPLLSDNSIIEKKNSEDNYSTVTRESCHMNVINQYSDLETHKSQMENLSSREATVASIVASFEEDKMETDDHQEVDKTIEVPLRFDALQYHAQLIRNNALELHDSLFGSKSPDLKLYFNQLSKSDGQSFRLSMPHYLALKKIKNTLELCEAILNNQASPLQKRLFKAMIYSRISSSRSYKKIKLDEKSNDGKKTK